MKKQNIKNIQHNNITIFLLIVVLGILYATIYALVMPPWGLLDESQHFHYVQFIAEEHRLPVMWQDQLSDDIIDSIFEVKRYVTLGSAQMPNREEVIVPGRLDSESYEAYQPPLYYLFLALFYPLGGQDVLSKLFFLRLIGVLLSSITLIAVWFSTRVLFPQHKWISIAATLFVALLPERVTSIAQVNNDVLLEVFSAISFYLVAVAIRKGITWRRTLLLAIVLSLAVLTKISALVIVVAIVGAWFFLGKHNFGYWQENIRHTFSIIVVVSISIVPLFIRNLRLYNDLTGMNAFITQVGGDLVQGSLSHRLAIGILDLFRNSWVILWDGLAVVTKPSATILFILLASILIWMIGAIIKAWFQKNILLSHNLIEISLFALVLMSLSVLLGYVRGFFPTVQGRFLLPVTVPSAWLVGLGLWLTGKRWRGGVAGAFFAVELTLGMSVLFFHSLPNYYAPRTGGFLGYWQQTVYLFGEQGFLWDKPAFVSFSLILSTLVAFATIGIIFLVWAIKKYGFPFRLTQKQFKKTLVFIKRKRCEIIPFISRDNRIRNKNQLAFFEQLKLFIRSPLLWVGVFFFIFYLGWISLYPPEIFWSLDEGGKFIHLKNIIATGNLSTSIHYPGGILDPKLEFVPLFFWSKINNEVYSWWAIGFPMVTIPFYRLFGWIGLYIMPAGFGAISSVLSGMIFRYLKPQYKWGSILVAVIVGIATPITFYSTTFWEHTVSSGLFLGGVLVILYAWKRQQYAWLFLAGALLSLATYFRTDTSVLFAGILVAFLIIRWRWTIIVGLGYFFSSIPWLLVNFVLTGDIFSRRELFNVISLKTSLFPAVRETGWWFIPYMLFNAPKIGAFSIPKIILAIATMAVILAVIFSVFLKKKRWGIFSLYVLIIAISGWVLFQSQGYRSVHGALLIAPHVIFSIGYFFKKENFRNSPFPLMVLGMIIMYAIIYTLKGWVAAGGLQWGPRYLIIFYPLLTVAAMITIIDDYFSMKRQLFLMAFGVAVIIGIGFQIRGMVSALQTRQYYEQTRVTVDNLPTKIIATDCPWLSMVMPEVYFDKMIFTVEDSDRTHWMNLLRLNSVDSFYYVKMDLCSLTPLEEIKKYRHQNPSGLTINYYNIQEGR